MALEFKFFKYFLFKLICLTLNNRTADLYFDVTNINLEISYNYTWRRLQLFTWRRLKLIQKHCLQLHMISTTTIHAMSTTTKCDANYFNFTGRRLQVHVTSTATSRGVDYNYTWLQPSSSFDLTHLLLLRISNIPPPPDLNILHPKEKLVSNVFVSVCVCVRGRESGGGGVFF